MPIETAQRLLLRRRCKIVATLGPASSDTQTIAALIAAGADLFRLNFSHGDHASHEEAFARIRTAAAAAGRHVGVLADLCGPKIRVGCFDGGSITLRRGETVTITTRNVQGEPGLIPSLYEPLAREVREGSRIMLADGAMELRVQSIEDSEVICRVERGGTLGDRKGMNLPDDALSAPCLTPKDRADAECAIRLGVDYLALSFVRRASDIAELRALIDAAGADTAIIAKIERPEALANSEAIFDLTDAVMIARGDLGVELPPEKVPVAQRQLIDHARRKNVAVIVATQMLESMIDQSRPTRAEVADVSHAVASGADAVMLSGETAVGADPVAAVEMMDRIAREAEAYLWHRGAFGSLSPQVPETPPIPFGDAIARAMALVSRDLLVRASVVLSRSGMSATTMSAARPAAPVLCVTPEEKTCRRVSLYWGVIPVLALDGDAQNPHALARRVVREHELALDGEFFLIVRGFHADPARAAPSITVLAL